MLFRSIRFEENGLHFEPFIPKVMAATRKLNNFSYRKAILDIELTGYGNRIASFMLDGKVQKANIVPTGLTGKHVLKIKLANNDVEKQSINLVRNESTPLTPMPVVENGKLSWPAIEGAIRYQLLKNGQLWNETTAAFFQVSSTESGEFQVLAIDTNAISSFASEPVQIYPDSAIKVYEVEKFLPPSTLSYHGFSGTGFVEISRTVNREAGMEVEIPVDGFYAIDWRYANGNGPTNTENKCAIRTLFIDQTRCGAQIFPQRGIGEWSNWGYSNSIKIWMKKGTHTLKLVFMPENENMNIEINQAMLDYVRVVKIQ